MNTSGNSSGSEDEKSDDMMRGKKMKRTSNKLPPVGNSAQNKNSPGARRSKRRKQRFQTRLATISD